MQCCLRSFASMAWEGNVKWLVKSPPYRKEVQCVEYTNSGPIQHCSSWEVCEKGVHVPQGSILGTSLFTIYIYNYLSKILAKVGGYSSICWRHEADLFSTRDWAAWSVCKWNVSKENHWISTKGLKLYRMFKRRNNWSSSHQWRLTQAGYVGFCVWQ